MAALTDVRNRLLPRVPLWGARATAFWSVQNPRPLLSAWRGRSNGRHAWHRLQGRRSIYGGLAIGIVGILLGCSGENPTALLAHNNSRTFWALQLNYRALNLATVAPYDTVQLIATPLDQTGTPIAGLSPATFKGSDSTVLVDSTGHVTAHFVTQGQPTTIIVSLTNEGVTLRDTVLVQVVNTVPPQPIDSFSLQPAPTDSAKRALNFTTDPTYAPVNFVNGTDFFEWPARITDGAQNVVCSGMPGGACPLLVYYKSSNPLVATVDPATGHVTPHSPGHVVLAASTYAYGVSKQDSVNFTIGYTLNPCYVLPGTGIFFDICPALPQHIILGVGTTVTFSNQGKVVTVNRDSTGITFVDTTAVDTASMFIPADGVFGPPTGSGNILPFLGDTLSAFNVTPGLSARSFPVAGIYKYVLTKIPTDTFTIEIRSGP